MNHDVIIFLYVCFIFIYTSIQLYVVQKQMKHIHEIFNGQSNINDAHLAILRAHEEEIRVLRNYVREFVK